jgi:hypothetical protein
MCLFSIRKSIMARIGLAGRSYVLALILMAVLVGCSKGAKDGYSGSRGTVSGTITLDDKPLLKDCQVMFFSDKGYTGAGVVRDGGQYTLQYDGGDGMPVGDYLVQLTAPVATGAPEVVDPVQMATKMKLGRKASGASAGPFPVKYASTVKSGLSYSIVAGANKADFKLTDK